MAADIDLTSAKPMQMSRRSLFRLFPSRTRKPRPEEEGVVEVERTPVVVHSDELRAHGTDQINELIARLSRRSEALKDTEA